MGGALLVTAEVGDGLGGGAPVVGEVFVGAEHQLVGQLGVHGVEREVQTGGAGDLGCGVVPDVRPGGACEQSGQDERDDEQRRNAQRGTAQQSQPLGDGRGETAAPQLRWSEARPLYPAQRSAYPTVRGNTRFAVPAPGRPGGVGPRRSRRLGRCRGALFRGAGVRHCVESPSRCGAACAAPSARATLAFRTRSSPVLSRPWRLVIGILTRGRRGAWDGGFGWRSCPRSGVKPESGGGELRLQRVRDMVQLGLEGVGIGVFEDHPQRRDEARKGGSVALVCRFPACRPGSPGLRASHMRHAVHRHERRRPGLLTNT